jgi:hypothetical protein
MLVFIFLEQNFSFSIYDSSRYPLYPRPKAWDTAAIGAIFHVYISIRTFAKLRLHYL